MKQMKSRKVAITGGSGGIGRYVSDYLEDKVEVTVIDISPPKQSYVGYLNTNILDFNAVQTALDGHTDLIHLAAIPNPRVATAETTFNTNVQGTWNVLQAAEDVGISRAIVASSDSAVGLHFNPKDWPPQYLPVDEKHPLEPTEFYSLSKLVTEVICKSFVNRGKLEIVVLRPSKVVLPHEWPELRSRGADLHNHHIWAYVEPEDLAQAFYLALAIDEITYDLFFISAADTLCSRPTLEMIEMLHHKLPEIRKPEIYEQNPYASVFDIDHARTILGYDPKSDWRQLFKQVPVSDRIANNRTEGFI